MNQQLILQLIGAFFSTSLCGMIFGNKRELLFMTGAIGTIGWGIYLYIKPLHGILWATFFGGVFVSLGSHIIARVQKCPVTVSLIPGFYPLVPGIAMFRMVSYFLEGNESMGSYYLKETFLTAGMIALSILLVDSLFNVGSRLYQKKRSEVK